MVPASIPRHKYEPFAVDFARAVTDLAIAQTNEVGVLALYLLSLGASAGAVGLFAHQLLAGQGFVPAFRAGLFLSAGTAFLYITLQLLYMVLIRLYKPTKDRAPVFVESLSHGAALTLLPYLLNMHLPLPSTLSRFEPLIYLGVFLSFHTFFKLMSLFAAVRGVPGPRAGGLVWLGFACACACIAYVGLAGWATSLESLRPEVSEAAEARPMDGQYAATREVPEGAQVRCELVSVPGQALVLLWAPDPAIPPGDIPSKVYVSVTLEGDRTSRVTRAVNLDRKKWTPLRLAPEEVPAGVSRCRIVWNAGKEPIWQKVSGVVPVVTSSRRLLMAGPFARQARDADSPPNLVVIMVDGLNANRVGKDNSPAARVAPSLSRLAAISTSFVNAYTPAPESAAAMVSLLTGTTPLRHGYLGARRGENAKDLPFLQEGLRERGYATAAFTEGSAGGIEYGTGVEQGFDLFDGAGSAEAGGIEIISTSDRPAAEAPAPTTSVDGFERAAAWLEANKSDVSMAFVRVRGLETAVVREGDNAAGAITIANYDNALKSVDRRLGPFIKTLQDDGNTCILLVGSFGAQGLADEDIPPQDRLAEVALHVPCILYVPGQKAMERKEVVSLEDLTAPVLRVIKGEPGFLYGEGRAAGTDEAVSLCGSPLALSIRSGGWRLTWQTQASPFVHAADTALDGTLALYDVELLRKGRRPLDAALRNPDAVARLRRQLEAYLQIHGNEG